MHLYSSLGPLGEEGCNINVSGNYGNYGMYNCHLFSKVLDGCVILVCC